MKNITLTDLIFRLDALASDLQFDISQSQDDLSLSDIRQMNMDLMRIENALINLQPLRSPDFRSKQLADLIDIF